MQYLLLEFVVKGFGKRHVEVPWGTLQEYGGNGMNTAVNAGRKKPVARTG
jgi:hypothetical protein